MRAQRQDQQADRRRLLRLIAVAAFSLLGLACDRPLTPDECAELLDRYTELLVRQEHKNVSDDEVARLQTEARARASMSDEFARCPARVSRRKWQCAMKAPNVDEVEKCLL